MLRLFGSPTSDDGHPLKARMAYVAVAMLDLSPARQMPRAALAERLWPAASSPAASNNLRQLLSVARAWEGISGLSLFDVDSRTIGRSPLSVTSDLWLLLQTTTAETTEALRRLGELYRGELLEGVSDLDGDSGLWLLAAREKLKDTFITLAVAGALRVRNDVAVAVLEKAALASPYDERVTRTQMVVAAASRRPAEAAQAYTSLATRLQRELGARPENSTSQLLKELGAGSAVGLQRLPDVLKPEVPRVLILPPVLSDPGAGGQVERLLADSLIDDVTHVLGSARTFAVFAPHTARQIAAQPFPGAEPYDADYLVGTKLIGTERGAGRLRFSVTDLGDHRLLLSEEMEFRHDDPRPTHDRLVSEIASRVTRQIENRELEAFRAGGTPSAYIGYLLGNEALRRVDLRALRRARKHFQDSLREAPDFVRSRAMLARTHTLEFLLLGRDDQQPLNLAMDQARQAIDADPTDPVSRHELGHTLIYLDRLDEAVDNLALAADRGPHVADILCTFADSLVHVGQNSAARETMDKALALNPLPPDVYHWTSATSHFMLGDYESAKGSILKMAMPASAGRIMAASEALLGNREAAFHHRDLFMSENPGFSLDNYLFPIRNPNRDHLIGGLRVAGFH